MIKIKIKVSNERSNRRHGRSDINEKSIESEYKLGWRGWDEWINRWYWEEGVEVAILEKKLGEVFDIVQDILI